MSGCRSWVALAGRPRHVRPLLLPCCPLLPCCRGRARRSDGQTIMTGTISRAALITERASRPDRHEACLEGKYWPKGIDDAEKLGRRHKQARSERAGAAEIELGGVRCGLERSRGLSAPHTHPRLGLRGAVCLTSHQAPRATCHVPPATCHASPAAPVTWGSPARLQILQKSSVSDDILQRWADFA